jgi:hypothetical protein
MSLFDLHMKYVDVTDLADVLKYLEGLEAGLFDESYPPAKKAGRGKASGR